MNDGKRSPRSSRGVAPVGKLIESALDSYHISKKVEEYAAFPHWPEIVGEEIARVAFPERIIRGKVLAVRVLDAAWAQELSMHKQEILDKLHEARLGAVIEDIQFLTGKPRTK